MITATCRTCHQDWTLDTLPQPVSMGVTGLIILNAPCGHGSFRGTFPLMPGRYNLLGEANVTWQWYNEAYFAAQAAIEQFYKKHPHPALDRWNPDPQMITCTCGYALVLEATEDEEWGEGWEGICLDCGLLWRVMDPENHTPYSRDRLKRYEQRRAAWLRSFPRVVKPLTVECLQEKAEDDHER